MGGLIGLGLFGALTVGILIDPGDGSRMWAVLFGAIAVAFLPAVWVATTPVARRQPFLRGVVIGCLATAFIGALFFGVGFAFLMLLPTTLLAVAAGLVFQGRQDQKARGKGDK